MGFTTKGLLTKLKSVDWQLTEITTILVYLNTVFLAVVVPTFAKTLFVFALQKEDVEMTGVVAMALFCPLIMLFVFFITIGASWQYKDLIAENKTNKLCDADYRMYMSFTFVLLGFSSIIVFGMTTVLYFAEKVRWYVPVGFLTFFVTEISYNCFILKVALDKCTCSACERKKQPLELVFKNQPIDYKSGTSLTLKDLRNKFPSLPDEIIFVCNQRGVVIQQLDSDKAKLSFKYGKMILKSSGDFKLDENVNQKDEDLIIKSVNQTAHPSNNAITINL